MIDGPGRSFRTQAIPADDGGVIVSWTVEDGRSLQGIAPPEVEAPQTDAKAAAALAQAANAAAQRRRGAVRLDLASGGVTPVPYTETQGKAPALSARIGGGASKAAGSVLGQLTSLDGKHVLTSERNPEDAWNRYRWTLTDAAGATVGTIVAPVSMAPFVVSGSRVVYIAEPILRKEGSQFVDKPLRLRAVDLQTGAEAWEAAVVDTTFRGPFPP
ncbi:MAG TPA: hypothetical protein VLE27_05210 [Thermoanaerobaculia bacterium]|nr:hypothetical protein [Thermoanaerobaculia bacterium]